MSNAQKRENFHRNIRREQKDSMFQSMRKQLITANLQSDPNKNYYSEEAIRSKLDQLQLRIYGPSIVNTNQQRDVSVYKVSTQDMQIIIKLTLDDSHRAISLIKNSPITKSLIQYLQLKWLHTEEQYYVTWIISNLFCEKMEYLPQLDFLRKVVALVEKGEARTKENCMQMLGHVIADFPEAKPMLVFDGIKKDNQHQSHTESQEMTPNIIDAIFTSFNSSPPIKLASEIFKFYFKLVYNLQIPSEYRSSQMKCFLFNNCIRKNNKFLFMVITYSNEQQLILYSLACLWQLSRMFPDLIQIELKHSRILFHLIRKSSGVQKQIYHRKLLSLLQMHGRLFDRQEFRVLILDYLNDLMRRDQLIIQNSSQKQQGLSDPNSLTLSMDSKKFICRIIYDGMDYLINHDDVLKHQIYAKLVNWYLQEEVITKPRKSTEESIAVTVTIPTLSQSEEQQLTYIHGLLLLNAKNQIPPTVVAKLLTKINQVYQKYRQKITANQRHQQQSFFKSCNSENQELGAASKTQVEVQSQLLDFITHFLDGYEDPLSQNRQQFNREQL